MDTEEQVRIQQNQQVIRNYLLAQFNGFTIVKDQSDGSLYHTFTVANIKTYTQYTLKVSGARLSDRGNTPESITRQLDLDNVANKMKATGNGGHFSWGFGSPTS